MPNPWNKVQFNCGSKDDTNKINAKDFVWDTISKISLNWNP